MWQPRTWLELEAAQGVVAEAIDLDFKAQLTSNTEIAKDITAMTVQGGVLAYGIAEDDQAVAAAITPIELRGAPERIQSIVDSAIWPRPVIEVRVIENPADSTIGVILVTAPASALAPHYVRERFPARSGTTTRYLAEREIAALYEQRHRMLAASEDPPILSGHLDPPNAPDSTRGSGQLRIVATPIADLQHPSGVYLGRPLHQAGLAARAALAWLSRSGRLGLLDILGDRWTPRGTIGWQLGVLPAQMASHTASVTCTHDLAISCFGSRRLDDVPDGVPWSAHEEQWSTDTLAFLSFAGNFFSSVPGASLLRIDIGLQGLRDCVTSAAYVQMVPPVDMTPVIDDAYLQRSRADVRELVEAPEAAARRLLDRMWISFVPEQTDTFVRLKSTV